MRHQASDLIRTGTDADPLVPGVDHVLSRWQGIGIALAGLGLGLRRDGADARSRVGPGPAGDRCLVTGRGP